MHWSLCGVICHAQRKFPTFESKFKAGVGECIFSRKFAVWLLTDFNIFDVLNRWVRKCGLFVKMAGIHLLWQIKWFWNFKLTLICVSDNLYPSLLDTFLNSRALITPSLLRSNISKWSLYSRICCGVNWVNFPAIIVI